MRAAIRSQYGPPGVLSIAEVERPTPADDEVVIKVRAATANRSGGIVAMPKRFDYVQAAACIEGPAYASGIFMRRKIKEGENALVNGATGAIGSAYLQLFHQM